MVRVSAGSLPEHNDPCDHGGHEGDSSENQGHVRRVVLVHHDAADRVALEQEEEKGK